MKQRNNYLTFIGGITLGILIMGAVVCFTISKVKLIDKTNNKQLNASNEEIEYQNEQENNNCNCECSCCSTKQQVIENNNTTTNNNNTSSNTNKSTTTKKSTTKKSATVKKKTSSKITTIKQKDNIVNNIVDNSNENIDAKSLKVLTYVENLDKTIFTEENIKKFGSSVKTSFITITDFIFYGTEIKGYTFNELTEQAKLYILDIAIKIDSKIEQYHPGYKEDIRLKVTDIKNKAAAKYVEVSEKLCTKMGDVACNQARQDLQTMKDNFGLTFDLLKIVGKDGLNSLKNWYEIFRES